MQANFTAEILPETGLSNHGILLYIEWRLGCVGLFGCRGLISRSQQHSVFTVQCGWAPYAKADAPGPSQGMKRGA